MIDFNKDVMPLKNRLYRLALRIVEDHAEAEDITQETLIRLWGKCGTLASAADAETLGLTVCRNLAIDATRRVGRNHEELDPQSERYATPSGESPIETLSHADRRQFIITKINQLPQKQRSVVQLRDIEGKSYREIATIMDISEDQVKINLFRARQNLKEACKKDKDYGL